MRLAGPLPNAALMEDNYMSPYQYRFFDYTDPTKPREVAKGVVFAGTAAEARDKAVLAEATILRGIVTLKVAISAIPLS